MNSTDNIDFHKYWSILKRRWLPAVATFGAVVALTSLYTSSKVPVYSAQGQLIFNQDKSSSLIGLNSTEQPSSQTERSQITEARIISSVPILQRALELVNLNNPNGTPLSLGELQQGLEITNVEGTDLLQVGYSSKDPKLAAIVVNQVMKAYVDSNLLTNRAAAISAGNFITAQLPMVKANVYRADATLRRFKEKNKITDLGQTQEAVAANTERIGSQIDTIETQLADLNSRTTALQKQLGMSSQQAMVASSLNQSPVVQGVLADFQDVQRKLADARSRYQESSPVIIQLKDKEAQLKALLQDQVAQILPGQKAELNGNLQAGAIQQELMADLIKSEVERVGLVTQMATLRNQQAFYQQKAAILPRLEQQYREGQRELSAAQSTYETLLKNLQEIKVIENRTVGNVRIVENAQVPGAPIASNKSSAMAAGVLAGILLAVAVLYVLEVLDKKIKTVKEARELFEYALLATIPVFGRTTKTVDSVFQNSQVEQWVLPVIERPLSSISESYRMLQANLAFLNSDKPLKVIVVTSSVPKEGKSTTCANLAAVMAQLGYSVLIIDADLRCPSQHQIWQIYNELGLVNVIAGNSQVSDAVIQKVMNNLHVLTAGVLTSNSPVLLDSRSMVRLIEQCPKRYDYVIIDTPPLAISADACILGKMADGVLLVTRPGLADSINSKVTKEYLDQSGQNILGIVINGVIPENETYSYSYQAEGIHEESGSRNPTSVKRKTWLDNLKFFRRF